MKLSQLKLFTDENLDPEVIAHLRQCGFDVADVCERGFQGRSDLELLRLATSEGRAVVTHDADFGTLAVLQGEPLIGVVYFRPGHISAAPTIGAVDVLLAQNADLTPPFILVVKTALGRVTVRSRQLGP